MEIRPIDPFDADGFARWHATYAEAERYGRGEHSNDWLLAEARVAKQADDPSVKVQIFGGFVADELVACAELEVYELDNREVAWAKVYTRPEARRRGYGSRLADHVEAAARSLGRTSMVTEVVYDRDAPADGKGVPDVEFAVRRGYRNGLGDLQRVLHLPVDRVRLVALAEEAAVHHRGYTLHGFQGPVPDDLVDGYAELAASLNTEAPLGDLPLEAETSDVTVFRAREDQLAAQGRTRWATVAVAPDGQVAGYTEVMVSSIEPARAYQWGTLVHRQHRGHRLGLALKARNLLALSDGAAEVKRIYTWNAEVNAHMVAVNDALGFEVVARMGEFCKRLG